MTPKPRLSPISYKFPYVTERPFVTAKIKSKEGKFRTFQFLLDSGSDFTIISKADAMLLGFDSHDFETIDIEIANGHIVQAQKIYSSLLLEETEIMIPLLIIENECECLLGRTGIFDTFDILISKTSQKIVFTKI